MNWMPQWVNYRLPRDGVFKLIISWDCQKLKLREWKAFRLWLLRSAFRED